MSGSPGTVASVTTGGSISGEYLLGRLRESFGKARSIDIVVSFLMESGVRMLLPDLKTAADRGVPIRLLTGTYLNITQPSALYLLKSELGSRIDLRLYTEKRSFHPKAYIFHYGSLSEIFVGSSNISRSALTSGIEWNYRFSSVSDEEGYTKFFRTFENLFCCHATALDDAALEAYASGWHRPEALKTLTCYEDEEASSECRDNISPVFIPRNAQIEALYALEKNRSEGNDRGLVIAATGVGKTALAAFDSMKFGTVLFVAHRDEILKNAARTFSVIRKSDAVGFFGASEKNTACPVIMASVATLGNDRYLNSRYFAPDRFDYIVLDEIHHGVAGQYQKIIRYFRPRFLLGLTATPDRLDGRSIFGIFDYNVPFRISLFTAINRGYLAPFRYFGIYDDTDYSGLRLVNGRYDSGELSKSYIGNVRRHDLIFGHYRKHGSERALGFCCSREHAEEMAREFSKRGVPSRAVYSGDGGDYSEKRDIAIEKLLRKEIRVIFSVDMFNEGVDIAALDMVMFLRPTESPVVFLQQLGRGLRLSRNKEYLTVLDFIGNYEKAGRVISILSEGKSGRRRNGFGPADLPEGCQADFDLRLISLFEEMEKKQLTVRERVLGEYRRIRDLLGKRPLRSDLFGCMDDALYRLILKRPDDNIFRHFLDFLGDAGDLTPEEEEILAGSGSDFLNMLETTAMTKVYKMPVLGAFLSEDGIRMQAGPRELLSAWKDFFRKNGNWKDLKPDMTYEKFLNIPDSWHLNLIMKMPVRFLLKTEFRFFRQPVPGTLSLCEEIREVSGNPAFREHFRDILKYRTLEYLRRRYDASAGIPGDD